MINAPNFEKIELWIKGSEILSNNSSSITKIEYVDSSMIISGNHIIITKHNEDDNDSVINSGIIYDISKIIKYKTYQKKTNL
jgi:hypothetical protein